VARNADIADLVMQARITNRLLAASLKTTIKQQELISLLAGTGASAADIADVLNTTAGTVAVALHRQKQKKKGATKR
jgi:DNA-directed RNA polymerase specialized sigma24 family protein